jgi:uncharacterized tellurite resistance protein B-like protein
VKSVGSLIEDHHAQEASHLLFASGLKASFTSLLATHPPLPDRVRRIDPTMDIDALPAVSHTSDSSAGDVLTAGADAGVSRLASTMTGRELMASIGTPLPAHVMYGKLFLESLTDSVRTAAHEPDGATALLFALLSSDGADASAQRAALLAHGGEELAGRVAALRKDVAALERDKRMSLLDLMQPALREVAPDQRPRIYQTAKALVVADRKTDVFEYAVLHLIEQRLKFGVKQGPAAPAQAVAAPAKVAAPQASAPLPKASLREDVQCVLSAVAWAGTDDSAAATRAFMSGVASLPRDLAGVTLLAHEAVAPDTLGAALSRLRVAKPGMRRTLLEACTHGVVAADGHVHAKEAELLRVIAESVDCPMPPVLATVVS